MARLMKDSGIEWIRQIPEEWETLKLKYVATFRQEKYSETDGNLNYIGLENIVGWQGRYIETDSQYDREQSIICNDGDILFGKLRPYLAKVYISTQRQCCSGEFAVISVQSRCYNRYVWYLLISHGFIFTVDRSTYGTKMPRANVEFIKNVFVPVPPMETQKAIAAYLDGECAKIDAVLTATRESIEEYKKLKQAVITQAVTKGVRGERAMKDSGIEWIDKIPADWEVKRGKQLFRETNIRSTTGTEELLTVSHITGITPRSQKNVTMFMAESLVDYKICEVNDLAANTMWMWQGAIGVSRYHGVISPSYNTYRQLAGAYDSDYLDYMLRIPLLVDVYSAYSTGITVSRLRLYPEQFLSIMFIVPPIDEQKEIAAYLNEKVIEINRLIEKKEQFIVELENYRKSLIYECVTGKREVV